VADLGPQSAELVAGVFNGAYFSGELVGQLFGAQLVQAMGFPAGRNTPPTLS
jgi:hypothetical protein